jgi:hypothetical protein
MDNETKLFIAMSLDFAGLVCAVSVVGEIFSPIVDVLGFILLGASRKKTKNFVLSSIGESIPFVGALPFWTMYVRSEIKSELTPATA